MPVTTAQLEERDQMIANLLVVRERLQGLRASNLAVVNASAVRYEQQRGKVQKIATEVMRRPIALDLSVIKDGGDADGIFAQLDESDHKLDLILSDMQSSAAERSLEHARQLENLDRKEIDLWSEYEASLQAEEEIKRAAKAEEEDRLIAALIAEEEEKESAARIDSVIEAAPIDGSVSVLEESAPSYVTNPLPDIDVGVLPAVTILAKKLNDDISLLSSGASVEQVDQRLKLVSYFAGIDFNRQTSFIVNDVQAISKILGESEKKWKGIADIFRTAANKNMTMTRALVLSFIENRRIDAENHRNRIVASGKNLSDLPVAFKNNHKNNDDDSNTDPLDILQSYINKEFKPVIVESLELMGRLDGLIRMLEISVLRILLIVDDPKLYVESGFHQLPPLARDFHQYEKWKKIAALTVVCREISAEKTKSIFDRMVADVHLPDKQEKPLIDGLSDDSINTFMHVVNFLNTTIDPDTTLLIFKNIRSIIQNEGLDHGMAYFLSLLDRNNCFGQGNQMQLTLGKLFGIVKEDKNLRSKIIIEVSNNFLEPMIDYIYKVLLRNYDPCVGDKPLSITTNAFVKSQDIKIAAGKFLFLNATVNGSANNASCRVLDTEKCTKAYFEFFKEWDSFELECLAAFLLHEAGHENCPVAIADCFRLVAKNIMYPNNSLEFKSAIENAVRFIGINLDYRRAGIDRSHQAIEMLASREIYDQYAYAVEELRQISSLLLQRFYMANRSGGAITCPSSADIPIVNKVKEDMSKLGFGVEISKVGHFWHFRNTPENRDLILKEMDTLDFISIEAARLKQKSVSQPYAEVIEREEREYIRRKVNSYRLDPEFNPPVFTEDLPYIDALLWKYQKYDAIHHSNLDIIVEDKVEQIKAGMAALIIEDTDHLTLETKDDIKKPNPSIRRKMFSVLRGIVKTPLEDHEKIAEHLKSYLDFGCSITSVEGTKAILNGDKDENYYRFIGCMRASLTELFYQSYSANQRLEFSNLKRPPAETQVRQQNPRFKEITPLRIDSNTIPLNYRGLGHG